MQDTVRGELHYIATDLDAQTWIEAGLARLEAHLALLCLFRNLDPSDPR